VGQIRISSKFKKCELGIAQVPRYNKELIKNCIPNLKERVKSGSGVIAISLLKTAN